MTRRSSVSRGLALLFAVAGQPIGLRSICPAADPPESPVVVRSAEPAPADGPAISVSGITVGDDGRPIPHATVVLRAKIGGQQYSAGSSHNHDILARTMTDTSGRFAFDRIAVLPRMADNIESLMRGKGGAEVLAWADGKSLVWTDVPGLLNAAPVRMTLPPEATVEGVVRDSASRGAGGVRVSIFGITRGTTEVDPTYRGPGDLSLSLSELSERATTNADGRFRLDHMPPNHRISTVFEGPGLARKVAVIDTGNVAGLTEIDSGMGRQQPLPVMRSPLSIALTPQTELRVKVVDHEDRPVSGGVVYVSQIDAPQSFYWPVAVNQRGEAAINLRQAGKYGVSYAAEPLHPRLGTNRSIDVAAQEKAATTELRLPAPIWMNGQVVEAGSNEGITGVSVCYSRKAEKTSEPASSSSVSGPDGRFRIPVAPGPGVLRVYQSVHGYLIPYLIDRTATPETGQTAIDVPETGEPKAVTVPLTRGLAVGGRVLGPDDKPVAGVNVEGRSVDRRGREVVGKTDAAGRFLIAGLSPRAAHSITVRSEAGVGRMSIAATPDHPWDRTRWVDAEIKLRPAVALVGRVTHNGKPRPGVRLVMYVRDPDDRSRAFFFDEATTDADGRYRFVGLESGDHYNFTVTDPDGMAVDDFRALSGLVRTGPVGAAEMAVPELRLSTRGQTLRGVVVDPQGKPLTGITVMAQFSIGNSIPRSGRGQRGQPTTDDQGRFEIRQLPDQPVELTAFRSNPKGGRIRHSSVVHPKLNQQDVRIVLDPALNEEIEDLDAPKPPTSQKP
jgi:hypothetical protein